MTLLQYLLWFTACILIGCVTGMVSIRRGWCRPKAVAAVVLLVTLTYAVVFFSMHVLLA